MEGNVFRVTYNAIKKVAELHLKDGSIKEIPMTNEEWLSMLKGNVNENFNKLLSQPPTS